ncbi:PQQ-binding-like beta-propeller repeat protein [Nocardia ignorata]|uniref:Putative pyrroloquinoline-quinone binding quinoprotein n=1 Tax=Nocardia ignorata TaxID=145285 RepID=A0A4R6PTH0_NOCIG|nr:PQQ-binding-like beta-propeller repeat protein [Nocardia ignorata]TDP41934.1 putative pyrroloquinoline-quinone binding quinoprotein [Nocardia ignorata]
MSGDKTTERARVLRSIPILAGLVGAVLLAGGVVLALYSQFVAAPIPVPFNGPYAEASDFPFRLVRGTLIFASAAALVGGVVLVLGRRGDERAVSVGAGGVLAILFVLGFGLLFAVTADVPSTYRRLTGDYIVTPRVPSAIAALVLVVLGAVLMFVFVAKPTGQVPRRSALAMAVVVGVVPVLGAAGVTASVGNDSVSIDHVTAAARPEAPAPAALGSEKYRLQLPVDPDFTNRIVVTRTGFVVSTPEGLSQYDGATGAERWHFRRGDARSDKVRNRHAETTYLRAEDVVLTNWRNIGWIAFDANTGEKLWTGEDFARDSRSVADGHMLVTVSERGQVTRYDARSGREMWTIPGESGQCTTSHRRVVAAMTAIYRAASCGEGEAATVVVTAFDPKSGELRDQRSFPTPRLEPIYGVSIRVFDSGFVWVQGQRAEVNTDILLPPDQPLAAALVDSNRTNSKVHATDRTAALVSAHDPDWQPMPGRGWPERWEVLSAAGAVSTELEMSTLTSSEQMVDAATLLADQAVTLAWDDGFALRTWDRSTGRESRVVPVTIEQSRSLRFATTSGSLVLIVTDHQDRDIEIIGFG